MDILHKYAAGHGNPNAKILILGESPAMGETHCMSSNKELSSMLKEAGINETQVWKTCVSKHYVPPNPKKGKKIPFIVRAKNYNVDIEQHLKDLPYGPPLVLLVLGLAIVTGKQIGRAHV